MKLLFQLIMEIHSVYNPGYTYRIPSALATYFGYFLADLKNHLEWVDDEEHEEKAAMLMLKVNKLITKYSDHSGHFDDDFKPSSLVLLEAAFPRWHER